MTHAEKRKRELEAYQAQFIKLVEAGKSSESVHTKMVKLTTTQLRSEIRQDRRRRTA